MRARRRAASRRPAGRVRSSTSRRGTRRAPRDPSGASHQNAVCVTADGTPRHTTACSRPGLAQELRHLRDVAEHVGQVADRHRAAELGGPGHAELQVAHDRLARDHELVHQDHPRPDREPPARGQAPQRLGRLGPHLEVVVEDGGLAVEQEPRVGEVPLEQREQSSSRSTSRSRNAWNGEYHSRSQWVCGTMATVGCGVAAMRRACRSIGPGASRTVERSAPAGSSGSDGGRVTRRPVVKERCLHLTVPEQLRSFALRHFDEIEPKHSVPTVAVPRAVGLEPREGVDGQRPSMARRNRRLREAGGKLAYTKRFRRLQWWGCSLTFFVVLFAGPGVRRRQAGLRRQRSSRRRPGRRRRQPEPALGRHRRGAGDLHAGGLRARRDRLLPERSTPRTSSRRTSRSSGSGSSPSSSSASRCMFGGFSLPGMFGYRQARSATRCIGSGNWVFLWKGGWALTDLGGVAATARRWRRSSSTWSRSWTRRPRSRPGPWPSAGSGRRSSAGACSAARSTTRCSAPGPGAAAGWPSSATAPQLGFGYVDFAGSGVVHAVGGVAGLAGALVLGARIGKYGPDGKPRTLAAHNIPMAMLGTFILLFGWFGFNAASTFAATDVRFATGRGEHRTSRPRSAPPPPCSTSCAAHREARPGHDGQRHARGPGGDHGARARSWQPWAAAVIGIVAGVLVVESVLVLRAPRHRRPGRRDLGARRRAASSACSASASSPTATTAPAGTARRRVRRRPQAASPGSSTTADLGFRQLGSQAIGALVIMTVIFGIAFAFFKIQNAIMKGGIRPTAEVEEQGLDLPEMGVLAYDNLVAQRARHRERRGRRSAHVGRTVTRSDDREVDAPTRYRADVQRATAGGR